jgi:beta propeller repeat protein
MRLKWAIIIGLIVVLLFAGYYYEVNIYPEPKQSNSKDKPVLLEINETYLITDNPANQDNPNIDGNYIVWQDDRNGNWDIYMFDLKTTSEVQITSDKSDQVNPKIFGDIIVWKDMRNQQGVPETFPLDYNSDIYYYNLSSKQEFQLTTNNQAQFAPDIYKESIIWLDYRSGNAEVYKYDLDTHTESKISNNVENITLTMIFKNTVMWRAEENNKSFLFKYDIKLSQVTILDLNSSSKMNDFEFNDQFIVWSDVPEQGNNADIFLYSFGSKEITQITTNESYQYGPILAGDDILWTDLRNDPDGWVYCPCKDLPEEKKFDNWDIYLYNSQATIVSERQITSETDSEVLFDIQDNLMVFIKTIKNQKNLYIMRFKA